MTSLYHCPTENIILAAVFFMVNQVNNHFSWAVVRTFVVWATTKPMLVELTCTQVPQRNERLKTAVSVNAMVMCSM